MKRRAIRVISTLLISMYFLLPSVVCAHAGIAASDPLQDSRVDIPPSEIRVKFTEQIDANLSVLTLRGEKGEIVAGELRSENGDELVLSVPSLEQGVYRVEWQVLSVDTHVTEGTFGFSVGVPMPKNDPEETISLDDKPIDNSAAAPQQAGETEGAGVNTAASDAESGHPDAADQTADLPGDPEAGSEGSARSAGSDSPLEPAADNPEAAAGSLPIEAEDAAAYDHDVQPDRSAEAATTLSKEEEKSAAQTANWNSWLRVIELFMTVVIVGSIVFCESIWRPVAESERRLTRRLIVIGLYSGLLLFSFAGTGHALGLAEQLGLGGGLLSKLGEVLTSDAGTADWLRPVIAAALLTGFSLPASRTRSILLWIICGALLATFPMSGHAMAAEGREWTIVFHMIHLAAVSVWMVGLVGLFTLSFKTDKKTLEGIFRRFSNTALWMAALVVTTGSMLTVVMLGSWEALFHTVYGQLIVWKSGLLLLIAPIAAFHRWVLMPAWAKTNDGDRKKWQNPLRIGLQAEILLIAVVIVLAGWLSTSSPH